MRILITILTFSLLTAFQDGQEKTILNFANYQTEFEIIKTFKTGYFVNSLENQQLHDQIFEIAIKAKKSHSNKNSYDKTVYTRIQMWQFDFETKEKRNQATDSLLNCFPNDCAKIKRQIEKGIKITPSIWIFTDKTIYIAKTACEQVDEKWTEFKREFSESLADNYSDIIVTECGKLTWTTKEKIKNAT
ncbi:hypothetical protein BST91_05645 [Nonlabens tegetincola]|uniref:hypothetical protein n=1 Tax=Nonlabens tegetincola TaxID=323273 RepID=UPI000A2041E2|nr:hypothetical protein [Nonlabens tegetincola]ARN71169.1 hypothetical protein BST91_05645 [Nonlabens tegetincola]